MGGKFWKGQKLTCGMFSVQFLRALSFHIRIARGSRGRLLLRDDPLDLKTLSLSTASPEFEQNLGLGGYRSVIFYTFIAGLGVAAPRGRGVYSFE